VKSPSRTWPPPTAGGLTIHGETLLVQTDQRIELVDLTTLVMELSGRFNMREGLVSLWSMHTTCSLLSMSSRRALLSDIKRSSNRCRPRCRVAAQQSRTLDCDRMNADSHLRALLLGHNLTLQVSGGEVGARQWQRI